MSDNSFISAANPALTDSSGSDDLIVVRGLTKHFPLTRGVFVSRQLGQVHAVDDVSLEVRRGETLGLVGETGCGKSTLARLVTRLIEPTAGQILFEGKDITRWSRRQLRPLRRDMQIILQDPYSALNPRRTVGAIIGEPLRIQKLGSKAERRSHVREVMEMVGLIPSTTTVIRTSFRVGRGSVSVSPGRS
jgi:oligopeptide transport system ATP-binding protein